MVWTPPTHIAASGEISSDSSQWNINALCQDNLTFLHTAHGCSIYRSGASPTAQNNTNLTITWNTETTDTDAFHDLVTNPDRITIPTGFDGNYDFTGSIAWGNSANGYREVLLLKNGGTMAFSQIAPAPSGECTQNFAFGMIPASAGDYFQILVRQTCGGNLAVLCTNPYQTWVSARWIGA